MAYHGTKLVCLLMITVVGMDETMVARSLLNLAVGVAIPACWLHGNTGLQMFVRSLIRKNESNVDY